MAENPDMTKNFTLVTYEKFLFFICRYFIFSLTSFHVTNLQESLLSCWINVVCY